MDSTEKLLRDLTQAHGISGYEAPVREVAKSYFETSGRNVKR